MELVQLFVGQTRSPAFYQDYFQTTSTTSSSGVGGVGSSHNAGDSAQEDDVSMAKSVRQWPEHEHASAYLKEAVDRIEVSVQHGIAGNGIGFPTHIANAEYRVAMVICSAVYADFEQVLPGSSKAMYAGCFGENMFVNDPLLHPNVVCVGDVYRIGTAVFEVTGPRMPCPKVDAFLGVSGVTALGRKTAWTGYFLRVLQAGHCQVGDVFELFERKYPGLTMTTIQQSLWGDADEQDHSEAFLTTLSRMDCLLPRHYRETATQRLARLQK